MKPAAVKKALMEQLRDDDEVQALLAEQIRAAVAEAVADRDREIADLKQQLKCTSLQLNELEQYSRRLCVNVSGVPETAGESTDRVVMDLARMAGVAVTPADIDRSHRVGKVIRGGTRSIIVRFTNFSRRQDFYNARRELRKPKTVEGSAVSTKTAEKVFISDNLTRSNQETMYEARRLRKAGKLHSAWTDVGKMKIRLREGAPTVIIRSTEELIAAADPDSQTAPNSVDSDRRATGASTDPDRRADTAPAATARRAAAAAPAAHAAADRRAAAAAPATPGTDREGFKPVQRRSGKQRGGGTPRRVESAESSE